MMASVWCVAIEQNPSILLSSVPLQCHVIEPPSSFSASFHRRHHHSSAHCNLNSHIPCIPFIVVYGSMKLFNTSNFCRTSKKIVFVQIPQFYKVHSLYLDLCLSHYRTVHCWMVYPYVYISHFRICCSYMRQLELGVFFFLLSERLIIILGRDEQLCAKGGGPQKICLIIIDATSNDSYLVLFTFA